MDRIGCPADQAVLEFIRNLSNDSQRQEALAVGVCILVAGYYIFEALIYPFLAQTIPFFGVPDAKAVFAEIPPNLLRGALSAFVVYGI